jgi:BMFP domain-containing protein YqiC
MPSTATTETKRHLSLPNAAKLDELIHDLGELEARFASVRIAIDNYYALQDAGVGRSVYVDNSDRHFPLEIDTFDVPTLEDIGRLFLFEHDAQQLLGDVAHSLESIAGHKLAWLDLVREAGASGRVERDGDA